MVKLDNNKIGLIFGIFLAIVHAIWAFLVAVIPTSLQSFLDWVFGLHFLEPVWILTGFNFLNAILLVVITFLFGYIFGFILAAVWNWVNKKK